MNKEQKYKLDGTEPATWFLKNGSRQQVQWQVDYLCDGSLGDGWGSAAMKRALGRRREGRMRNRLLVSADTTAASRD